MKSRILTPFIRGTAWICLAGALSLGSAMSQDPPPPAERHPGYQSEGGKPGFRREGGRREKAREMMMSLKIWKLTEDLQIDEKLSEKLYPRVRELDELRFQQMKEMEKLNEDLRMAVGQPGISQDRVKDLVKAVMKLRSDHVQAETQQISRIFELLDPQQQAKFLLLEADFHQNIRRFLRDQQREFRDDDPEPDLREKSGFPR
ncbi:hypothetical protein JW823_05435 [bacterium]|nr:hypothetical protein [candidate division CSSED10-310 bacterium]